MSTENKLSRIACAIGATTLLGASLLSGVASAAEKIRWQVPLGDYPLARELGYEGFGSENYGGPVVTASGLTFVAATPDAKLRAFDSETGALLQELDLPAAGFATPAIYEADGKPFVVVAAGGGKLDQPSDSAWIAFSLPGESND